MDRGELPHLTDPQFESVRKMVGNFGGDARRSLAAATPTEQVECIEAFDTYERGLIALVQGLQAPVVELKSARSKPLRLKVNPYEGKEGENLHFWVRELFLVHANTMEETIQIALQEEYSHRQARTPTSVWQGHNASSGAVQGAPAAGASTGPLPMELDGRTEDDKFADDLRESEGIGQGSVTLADDMDKYDLIQSTSPGSIGVAKPWGLTGPQSPTELCLATGRETKLITKLPGGTDQVGNISPQTAEAVEEDAESASGVGNIVPHEVEETEKIESAVCVSRVGNRVPRGVKKTSTRAEVSLRTSRVDNQVPHSESETPPARPFEDLYHVFDDVSGRQVKAGAVHLEALPEVSALLNLEELSMEDFLAELKAGEIAEMVLLKPETSPEDLNSSSVMDEDALEGFTKQRTSRLGSLGS
ncbi:Pol protein [Phytophthora palmivora]|uniref:Pol protein n=1 Tax=Phytophthora palmivora TaxID=4796 RepID=A0A2P4Y6Y9_9STRA|nr:Pol protein [Phytophthora palmivora]